MAVGLGADETWDQEGEPIVLALLDGDGCIVSAHLLPHCVATDKAFPQFNRQFVSKGRDGGREAALALTRHISRFADETIGRSVQVICASFPLFSLTTTDEEVVR